MNITLNEKIAFKHPEWAVDFHIWNQKSTLQHDHTFYEIMIVTEGSLAHFINGQEELLIIGDMRFIRPEDSHFQMPIDDSQAKTINICFNKSYIEECAYFIADIEKLFAKDMLSHIQHLNSVQLEYVKYLSYKVTKSSSDDDELRNIKLLVLTCINNLIFSNYEIRDRQNKPDWFVDFLKTVSNPHNFSLSVSDLCKTVNYTPSSMSVIFKKYMGVTIVSYITDVKMTYACNLLRNTNYSVLEICSLLGYDSLSHFDHTFKKHTGYSPAIYRKNNSKTII